MTEDIRKPDIYTENELVECKHSMLCIDIIHCEAMNTASSAML